MSLKPQGRLGDKSLAPIDVHGKSCCPHIAVSGPAIEGSPDVFVNGLSALRVGDKGIHFVCCGTNDWKAMEGSDAVFINGKPACRLGDKTKHCGGDGTLIAGSQDVLVGGNPTSGGQSESSAKQDDDKALEEKKKRLKEREELIKQGREKAKQTGNKKLEEASNRLEKNTEVVEKANLSRCAYSGKDGCPPVGWEVVADKRDKNYTKGSRSGFHAVAYRSTLGTDTNLGAKLDGKVIVAYEGTNFTSGADWVTNLKQGLGYRTAQYDQAVQFAEDMQDKYGNIEVTGHSLGGGLAGTAGTVLGVPGTTFNAAGVHPNTLAKGVHPNTLAEYGHTRDEACGLITNYHNEDILTNVQENPVSQGIFKPLATILSLPNLLKGRSPFGALPTAVGNSVKLPRLPGGPGALGRHGIDEDIKSIEAQKQNDQKTIKSSLSPK